jgi:hypothetical protein
LFIAKFGYKKNREVKNLGISITCWDYHQNLLAKYGNCKRKKVRNLPKCSKNLGNFITFFFKMGQFFGTNFQKLPRPSFLGNFHHKKKSMAQSVGLSPLMWLLFVFFGDRGSLLISNSIFNFVMKPNSRSSKKLFTQKLATYQIWDFLKRMNP